MFRHTFAQRRATQLLLRDLRQRPNVSYVTGSLCHIQRQHAFDFAYFVKLAQPAISWASNKVLNSIYEPTKNRVLLSLRTRSVTKKEIAVNSRKVIMRSNNQLMVDDKEYRDFKQDYSLENFTSDSEEHAFIPILVLGRRKKRKSTLATTMSLLMSNQGCTFSVGNNDSDETVGFDVSPPLRVAHDATRGISKHAVFVDFEGLHLDSNTHFEMIAKWREANESMILFFACVGYIEEEDVMLLKSIYDEMKSARTDFEPLMLCVVLSSSSSSTPENDNGIQKITETIDKNAQLYVLPHIAQEEAKNALESDKQRNPFKHLSAAQTVAYQSLGNEVVEKIARCHHKELSTVERINQTVEKCVGLTYQVPQEK